MPRLNTSSKNSKPKPRPRPKPSSRPSSRLNSKPRSNPKKIRLNKFIADCGMVSRRKADVLIIEGLVQINGKTAQLGDQIDPHSDRIFVKGKPIHGIKGDKVYLMFHKPKKVLTSMEDPEGRSVVADFFKNKKFKKTRLFPVGRLDWDTEGLLIMTNDGDFSQLVTHPKEEIPKTYLAKLDGNPSMDQLNKLKRGVSIVGGKVKALHVEKFRKKNINRQGLTVAKRGKSGGGDKAWVQIIISEGKNRQVRRMFEKIGFDVIKLRRIAIGQLKLGKLPRGQYVELSESQRKRIFYGYSKRVTSHGVGGKACGPHERRG